MDEIAARRKLREQRSAATGLVPLYAVFLTKPDRPSRLYRIDPMGAYHWKGEVSIGSRLHRVQHVAGKHDALLLRTQFEREVRELIADGWTER